MSGPVARRIVVHGRVHGVFFRASTRQVAARQRVAGWVRNRADGTVEVWLEGHGDGVEAVEAWIHAGGPPAADVTAVEVTEQEPLGLDAFEVRRG